MSNVIAKTAAAVLTLMLATAAWGQNATPEFGAEDNYLDRVRVDRYLDVEIWTNHADGDYLVGDEIEISFRANRDAFVVIYTVDSRGRVNMLFPSIEGGDNYVHGGVTYRLPDEREDYDLVVTGPEGIENIQAIASRERIAIPDWYPNSGLECDWDDRHDFMDYVNGRYFLRYEGQRLAFDRAALNIYDWEREYYRPVYVPRYPSWTLCGNVYVDYYHGSSIYIDGVYWGCAPLYMPRLYVGWHTFTVYDRWGHCWEHDVHVSRFHTVVLDRQVVVTRPATVSKYKEVRFAGYRDPIRHGYPKFDKTKLVASKPAPGVGGRKNVVSRTTTKTVTTTTTKKYVRGNGAVVKTERGLESVGSPSRGLSKRSESRFSTSSRSTSKSESSEEEKLFQFQQLLPGIFFETNENLRDHKFSFFQVRFVVWNVKEVFRVVEFVRLLSAQVGGEQALRHTYRDQLRFEEIDLVWLHQEFDGDEEVQQSAAYEIGWIEQEVVRWRLEVEGQVEAMRIMLHKKEADINLYEEVRP